MKRKTLVLCAALSASLIFSVFTLAADSEYNSEADPLISYSYLEARLGELKTAYEKEITDLALENEALTAEIDKLTSELEAIKNDTTADDAIAAIKAELEVLKNNTSGGDTADSSEVAALKQEIVDLKAVIEELKNNASTDNDVNTEALEKEIAAIKASIEALKNEAPDIDEETIIDAAYGAVGFVPYFFEYGDVIYPAEDTVELILRVGRANVVSPFEDQGLTNITNGTDMLDGANVIKNHLLIVPRKDGRGIEIMNPGGAWVMIRGEYVVGE